MHSVKREPASIAGVISRPALQIYANAGRITFRIKFANVTQCRAENVLK